MIVHVIHATMMEYLNQMWNVNPSLDKILSIDDVRIDLEDWLINGKTRYIQLPQSDPVQFDEDQLKCKKLSELKTICKELGCKTTGTKQTLVDLILIRSRTIVRTKSGS